MAGQRLGLPGPQIGLVVLSRGQPAGRFVLTPTPGDGVTLQARLVAVALVDQVASLLAPHRHAASPSRQGGGVVQPPLGWALLGLSLRSGGWVCPWARDGRGEPGTLGGTLTDAPGFRESRW